MTMEIHAVFPDLDAELRLDDFEAIDRDNPMWATTRRFEKRCSEPPAVAGEADLHVTSCCGSSNSWTSMWPGVGVGDAAQHALRVDRGPE